jgi:hypothetical protein
MFGKTSAVRAQVSITRKLCLEAQHVEAMPICRATSRKHKTSCNKKAFNRKKHVAQDKEKGVPMGTKFAKIHIHTWRFETLISQHAPLDSAFCDALETNFKLCRHANNKKLP